MQLHKRDVVDAATTLLDNYGIADLTMRRLARELNVSPGALYWHFANKQQLLGAVADRILAPVGDGARRAGATASRRSARQLRDALLSHTDGAELVSASFAAGQSEAMARILARLTDAAADAGVDPAHAELAARTVVYYVLGSPPTNSPGCSGTPRAPSCPTSSRCWRTIRARGSRSGCGCSSTASPRTVPPTPVSDENFLVKFFFFIKKKKKINLSDGRLTSGRDHRRRCAAITSTLPRSYEVVVRDRSSSGSGGSSSLRSRATRR